MNRHVVHELQKVKADSAEVLRTVNVAAWADPEEIEQHTDMRQSLKKKEARQWRLTRLLRH